MYRPDQTDEGAILTARHSANLKPETIIGQYEDQTKPPTIPENVTGIDFSTVDPKDYPLFEKFFELTREITRTVRQTTFDTLTDDPENWGTDRKKIIDKLRADKLDQPHFRIVSKERLPKVAKEINLILDNRNQQEVKKNKWFCIFTLPKPIDKFWHKAAPNHPSDIAVEKQIIFWGEIYEKAMFQIWGLKEEYQSASGLTLFRLNDPGKHEFAKYYYVWGLRLADETLPLSTSDEDE